MSLMGRELDDLNMGHFGRDHGLRSLMTCSVVHQENSPRFVWLGASAVKKVVKPSHTNPLICVPSRRYCRYLMACHSVTIRRLHNNLPGQIY
jgi:hypothetical protein